MSVCATGNSCTAAAGLEGSSVCVMDQAGGGELRFGCRPTGKAAGPNVKVAQENSSVRVRGHSGTVAGGVGGCWSGRSGRPALPGRRGVWATYLVVVSTGPVM